MNNVYDRERRVEILRLTSYNYSIRIRYHLLPIGDIHYYNIIFYSCQKYTFIKNINL